MNENHRGVQIQVFTHCGGRRAPTQTRTIQPSAASQGQSKLTTQNALQNSHLLLLQTSLAVTVDPEDVLIISHSHSSLRTFRYVWTLILWARSLLDVCQDGLRPTPFWPTQEQAKASKLFLKSLLTHVRNSSPQFSPCRRLGRPQKPENPVLKFSVSRVSSQEFRTQDLN